MARTRCVARRCVPLSVSLISLLLVAELLAQTECGHSGTCELQALTEEQTFTSPNFSRPAYLEDGTTWRITANHSHHVNLTLESIDMTSKSCQDDYLQVLDENEEDQYNLANICPGELLRTYISSYNSILIKYVGSADNGLSFKFYYQSVLNPNGDACTGVPLLVKASAIVENITTPNYPLSYPLDTNCAWRILTEDKDTVLKIHLESGHLEDCYAHAHSHAEITDGPTVFGETMVKLCGRFLEQERVSSSYALFVTFHSGPHATDGAGFLLTYQAVNKEKVFHKDLVATQEVKEVTYPSYLSLYQNHANVSWTIRSDGHKPIRMFILYYEIELSSQCKHDVLEIYDGPNESVPRLKRLCGVRIGTQFITSSGPVVFIRFVSDGSVVKRGFKFRYSNLEPTNTTSLDFQNCPAEVLEIEADGFEKEITSPGFPDYYPTNVFCQWRITSDLDFVSVRIERLALKRDTNCRHDYLRIYNGHSSNQPILKSLCRGNRQRTVSFTSTSKVIYMKFRSGREASSEDGFQLYVQSTESITSGYDSNPSKSDSDDKGAIVGGVVAGFVIFLIVVLIVVLRVRYWPRVLQARSRLQAIISRPVTTLRIGRVIQTDRQRAGVYVPRASGSLENNTTDDDDLISCAQPISNSQLSLQPPDYNSRDPVNSLDKGVYVLEDRTGSHNPQAPNDPSSTV